MNFQTLICLNLNAWLGYIVYFKYSEKIQNMRRNSDEVLNWALKQNLFQYYIMKLFIETQIWKFTYIGYDTPQPIGSAVHNI